MPQYSNNLSLLVLILALSFIIGFLLYGGSPNAFFAFYFRFFFAS